MRKSMLTITAAAIMMVTAGVASAQTTTTTTWTTDQGAALRTYSTTQKYISFDDPTMRPAIGMVLPGTVTVYPLPSTVTVSGPDTYSYGLVNNRPVVVNRTTRQIVHTWD